MSKKTTKPTSEAIKFQYDPAKNRRHNRGGGGLPGIPLADLTVGFVGDLPGHAYQMIQAAPFYVDVLPDWQPDHIAQAQAAPAGETAAPEPEPKPVKGGK